MNILVIKNNEKKDFDNYIESVRNYYKQNIDIYKNNVKFILEKNLKQKIDIYLILSDDISYIEDNFQSIKNKENILIITNKFEPKHILSCLLLTENLFSIRKGEEYILQKIIDIYDRNRSKSIKRKELINA